MDVVGCEIKPWQSRDRLIAKRIYESDAKTYRTPKALRAKSKRAFLFREALECARVLASLFHTACIAQILIVPFGTTKKPEACATIFTV